MRNKELERDIEILSRSGHSGIGKPFIGYTGNISKPGSGPIMVSRKAHKLAVFSMRQAYNEFIKGVKERERKLGQSH
jgi:hypothetical protein